VQLLLSTLGRSLASEHRHPITLISQKVRWATPGPTLFHALLALHPWVDLLAHDPCVWLHHAYEKGCQQHKRIKHTNDETIQASEKWLVIFVNRLLDFDIAYKHLFLPIYATLIFFRYIEYPLNMIENIAYRMNSSRLKTQRYQMEERANYTNISLPKPGLTGFAWNMHVYATIQLSPDEIPSKWYMGHTIWPFKSFQTSNVRVAYQRVKEQSHETRERSHAD